MNIWENIDLIRKKKGMTLKELAVKAGFKPQSLYQMRSINNPTLRNIEKIAKALDVEPVAFFLPRNG